MIADWLVPRTLDDFKVAQLRREPFVQPDTASGAIALLDWSTVGRLLALRPDMFVVRNGRPREGAGPRALDEARQLFADGWSFVIRNCEEHDDGLNALATAFERDFDGDAAVHVFVTPPGHQSFGWHYDCEEVFIVQTGGSKDYWLRQNTVNPRPTIDAMPRDMRFELERTPVITCTLVAGDWLYIPRGWWHVARGREESLSISTGVLTPDARGSRPRRAPAPARRRRPSARAEPAE